MRKLWSLMLAVLLVAADAATPTGASADVAPDPGEIAATETCAEDWQWPEGQAQEVPYVALGDSIAAGVGAPRGQGYVQALANSLGLAVANEARPGLTSCGLLQQLYRDTTTVTELGAARLVTVSIGGNDLLRCRRQDDFDTLCAARAVAAFRANWLEITARMGSVAPEARVQVLTVYNPFPTQHPLRSEADAYIRLLNRVIERGGGARGYEVIDAYGGLSGNCELLRCEQSDVHPSARGHQALAGLHGRQ